MYRKLFLIIFIFSLTYTNCYSQKRDQFLKRGVIKTKNYLVEIPFHYVNKHIFIDVWIGNKKYHFLFDTGYELSVIDSNIANEVSYNFKKEIEISGSSISTEKVKLVELPNIMISTIDFENTYGIVQDLSVIKRNYDSLKVEGIIGNNLMRKAKWQIDYSKKVIRISDKTDKFENIQTAKTVRLNTENWGLGYINIEINNKKHKFLFDLGSSGKFTANHSFLQNLKEKNTIIKEEKIKFSVNSIKIGAIEINNTFITLEKNVSSLIGNAFFENYLLTIDWEKNLLFLNENISNN